MSGATQRRRRGAAVPEQERSGRKRWASQVTQATNLLNLRAVAQLHCGAKQARETARRVLPSRSARDGTAFQEDCRLAVAGREARGDAPLMLAVSAFSHSLAPSLPTEADSTSTTSLPARGAAMASCPAFDVSAAHIAGPKRTHYAPEDA